MKLILKLMVLAMFSGLFLMQTTALAQKDQTTGPGKNSSSSYDLKIEFPEIDGWDKGEIQKYPTAALGYSISYQSEEGGIVTIYVYNAGQSKIPDDLNDKILKNELDKAKNDIIQAGKAGYYENVKELKNDTVNLGGTIGKTKSLRSLFSFKLRGQDVNSEIYLFGYENNFIKIRATRPKTDGNSENKVFTNFLGEIDKLFTGGSSDKKSVVAQIF